MARDDDWDGVREENERRAQIRLAVQAEREACAKVVESFDYDAWNKDYSRKEVSKKVAHTIRARVAISSGTRVTTPDTQ